MIITVSRQLGSEGDTIAFRAATALGLELVDSDYICRKALAVGVPAELLQKLMYEGRHNLAGEILGSLGSTSPGLAGGTVPTPSPLEGIFTPMLTPPTISLEESARVIGSVIKDIASRGEVLVLGQGGQVWLRDHPNAFHVQVVAPLDLRVKRVASQEKLSLATARREVRVNDQARAEYLARYLSVNWLDPLLYHIVINTGYTSPEAAATLVVQAAQIVGRGA